MVVPSINRSIFPRSPARFDVQIVPLLLLVVSHGGARFRGGSSSLTRSPTLGLVDMLIGWS
jgi:hypothetical protein